MSNAADVATEKGVWVWALKKWPKILWQEGGRRCENPEKYDFSNVEEIRLNSDKWYFSAIGKDHKAVEVGCSLIKAGFKCIYFRVCPIRRWGWLREAKTSQVFLSSSLLRSVLTFMKSFSTSVLNDLYNHRNHHCDLIILEEQVIVLILLPLLVLLVKLQVIPNFYHFWSIH